jgi:hypothetical protein
LKRFYAISSELAPFHFSLGLARSVCHYVSLSAFYTFLSEKNTVVMKLCALYTFHLTDCIMTSSRSFIISFVPILHSNADIWNCFISPAHVSPVPNSAIPVELVYCVCVGWLVVCWGVHMFHVLRPRFSGWMGVNFLLVVHENRGLDFSLTR